MESEKIIIELLKSLNQGKSYYLTSRVDMAIYQYNQLIDRGIIKGEKKEHKEID
ncbi:MAG: hypothetical protein ACOCP4_04285 [Candidatus Woesearchaeota archaeon]